MNRLGTSTPGTHRLVSRISRRQLLTAAAAGLGGLAIGGAKAWYPPGSRGIFGASDALTFASHRLILAHQPLVREFDRTLIAANFPTNGTTNPEDTAYQALRAAGFKEWRLPVEGLVSRPGALTLADLKAMPARTQITQLSCEEGWSSIAEWTGVPLARVLLEVGIMQDARYVVFETVDGWWDSLDMFDALHPQTLLTYGMNGGDLPVAHGAPLRIRVERQLGYKSLKFLHRMIVTSTLRDIKDGSGAGVVPYGFPWYAGI
jgi:DMSO/TMAO reductase YedYZ molybdopterin-dependent catalytic subunit